MTVGATAVVGSLVGGVASRWLPGSMLLAIFAAMAPFHWPLALLTGGGVRLGEGLVGAGGPFCSCRS